MGELPERGGWRMVDAALRAEEVEKVLRYAGLTASPRDPDVETREKQSVN